MFWPWLPPWIIQRATQCPKHVEKIRRNPRLLRDFTLLSFPGYYNLIIGYGVWCLLNNIRIEYVDNTGRRLIDQDTEFTITIVDEPAAKQITLFPTTRTAVVSVPDVSAERTVADDFFQLRDFLSRNRDLNSSSLNSSSASGWLMEVKRHFSRLNLMGASTAILI